MADVVLDAMPGAAGLYAKALASARRPDVAAGLAATTVRLAGHRCTVAEVAAYNSVCGFVLADELPATWLHVLTFPLQLTLMTAPGFPLALAGLVQQGMQLRDQIRGFAAAGTTVIVSSHILSEVQQMADTIGIICGGRLAYEDALRPGQDLEELFMSFCREGRRARGEVAA